jgi:poly(A) polymerase
MKTYLPYQEWRNSTATEAIVKVFERQGNDVARFVGGNVRNALLNIPISDIDIATILKPETVKFIFELAGFKVIETGLKHGTVSVVSQGEVYEITTLRVDTDTDGRHAEVEFTTDWYTDSCRRDFTCNSLYATFGGEVIDFHNGIEDLKAGRVVFVGDAQTRIQEDYLRILRFYRFNAYYGKADMDMQGRGFCTLYRDNLKQISAERISSELLKTLAAPNRTRLKHVVQCMHNSGILDIIIPNYRNLTRFHRLAPNVNDPILLLASMLPNFEDKVRETGNLMRLSSEQTTRMVKSVVYNGKTMLSVDPKDIRKNAYRIGVQSYCDQMQLLWASNGQLTQEDILEYVKSWKIPKRPVNGSDLIALGMSTGKELGMKLKEYEDKWIDSDFSLNLEDLIPGSSAYALSKYTKDINNANN